MNEQSAPWDDLKTVLAIAEAGSLSGAARGLGVSHATVFRRLRAIEDRFGVKLFDRDAGGYTPTPAGEDIAQAAKRMESEVVGVERRVAGRDLLPSGSLRITTTDTLLSSLLTPILAAFRSDYPEIRLEVSVSNAPLSLARREADVAVRATQSPPENLAGRRVGSIAQAVYGAAPAIADCSSPDYGGAVWVGPDETQWYTRLDAWMKKRGFDARCGYRVDSLQGMQSAVRQGIGVAVLPCYVGDPDEHLVRLGDPIPELSTDLWLLTHPDLRRVVRVRAFTGYVGDAVHRRHRLLAGT